MKNPVVAILQTDFGEVLLDGPASEILQRTTRTAKWRAVGYGWVMDQRDKEAIDLQHSINVLAGHLWQQNCTLKEVRAV